MPPRRFAEASADDYRLAPEHRCPAAHEDALQAIAWVRRHARALGADPARIAVSGDSAGACVAVAASIALRDTGLPPLQGQMLFYPVLDHPSSDWPSYAEFGSGYGLMASTMRWYWDQYLPGSADLSCPTAVPLRAASLEGLPRAFIQVAEFDVLRDEAEAYAARLAAAGVPVACTRVGALNRGFLKWVDRIPCAPRFDMRRAAPGENRRNPLGGRRCLSRYALVTRRHRMLRVSEDRSPSGSESRVAVFQSRGTEGDGANDARCAFDRRTCLGQRAAAISKRAGAKLLRVGAFELPR